MKAHETQAIYITAILQVQADREAARLEWARRMILLDQILEAVEIVQREAASHAA